MPTQNPFTAAPSKELSPALPTPEAPRQRAASLAASEDNEELNELAERLEARIAAGNQGAQIAQESVEAEIASPRGADINPQGRAFDTPPAGKIFIEPKTPQPKPPVQAVAAAAPKKSGPRAQYDAALKLAMDWKSKEARAAFEKFLDEHPKHALVPNALYWKGETHYQEKDYADAVLTFRKVHQGFPKHQKAADSLLKIGYSYRNLGDGENARFYFNVLLEEYPDTRAARIARANIESL
jgi:tol-pal system protein YbgF